MVGPLLLLFSYFTSCHIAANQLLLGLQLNIWKKLVVQLKRQSVSEVEVKVQVESTYNELEEFLVTLLFEKNRQHDSQFDRFVANNNKSYCFSHDLD